MTEDQPPQRPPNPFLFEPERDSFTKHKTTPNLSDDAGCGAVHNPPLQTELERELDAAADKEAAYDVLRAFKRRKYAEIRVLESDPLANRRKIMTELALVADAVLNAGYAYVKAFMDAEWGHPSYLSSYKQTLPAALAVIGMGKLGGLELNYESDLDLVFVYSHVGETAGKKSVSNAEYFARFAQKFLNLLSVQTSAGRCYDTDVELRPSGNAGTLVASLESFLDHQMNRAEEWERLALLRARVVAAPEDFRVPLERHLDELAFGREPPKDFFPVMRGVRERVLAERVREAPGQYDLKLGAGSLMDVEFVLQGLQMKNQRVFPQLKRRSSFELIDALSGRDLIPADDLRMLSEAHLVYRTMEAKIHLARGRAEHVVSADSDDFAEIAAALGYSGKDALKEKLDSLRHGVRAAFERMYHAP
jgi:glutamate-ammonia-ligase adenylyltransferase